jgi:RHS repeat-associated protein
MTSINSTNVLSYDYENRLIETDFAETTNTYQYDGVGNRLSASRSGVVTRYVLDRGSPLTQVLAETDSAGAITAYYIYGLGLISRIDFNGNVQYYHYDSRGSTVAMTDEAGQITDAYAYDPFGRPRAASGITDNRFRYLGRHGVVDEENGLNYIRARYYSTRRGRFITKDPMSGTDGDSQSINRYIYALNNPVRLIDISGLSPLETGSELRRLATSDSSLLHNYLISPTTAGLSADRREPQRNLVASAEQVASAATIAEGAWDVLKQIGRGAWKTTQQIGGFVVENSADLYKLTSNGVKGLGVEGTINPVSVATGMGITTLEQTPELAQIWAVEHPKAVQQNLSTFVSTYKAVGYSYEEAWSLYRSYNVLVSKAKFTEEWNNGSQQ